MHQGADRRTLNKGGYKGKRRGEIAMSHVRLSAWRKGAIGWAEWGGPQSPLLSVPVTASFSFPKALFVVSPQLCSPNFLVFLSCLFLALLPRVSVGRKCDVGAKKNKKGAYFYTFAMHVTNECDTCCELARGSRQTRAGGVVCTRSTDPGIPVAFALCTCCALQWVCGWLQCGFLFGPAAASFCRECIALRALDGMQKQKKGRRVGGEL